MLAVATNFYALLGYCYDLKNRQKTVGDSKETVPVAGNIKSLTTVQRQVEIRGNPDIGGAAGMVFSSQEQGIRYQVAG